MKKRIDLFWYFFLIIVAFVVCFMFSSTRASAASSGGVVVDPGDNSGDMSANPPISGEELYEQCHTYITTNIISAESLTEALNGKIYGNFTQEDCMEMINIASKREVIKNILNVEGHMATNSYGMTATYNQMTTIINYSGTPSVNYARITNQLGQSLDMGTYTLSISEIMSFHIVMRVYYVDNTEQDFYLNKGNTFGVFELTKLVSDYYIFANAMSSGKFYDVNFYMQLEKGSNATRYVSYDYHREYYEEGIDYADSRVNTESTSYTQGITDADNRVNTDSVNYKTGQAEGYDKANRERKILGDFIPSLLGGFGSFFLTLLNIDILGFNLLTVLGILITVLGIVVVIKFLKG